LEEKNRQQCFRKTCEFKKNGKTVIFVLFVIWRMVFEICNLVSWIEETRLKLDGPAGVIIQAC
jgi:hypothetical protein